MRQAILYLGLELPSPKAGVSWIHYPMIEIRPRPFTDTSILSAFSQLRLATHLIITSKQTAKLLIEASRYFQYPLDSLLKKTCLSVGIKTTTLLQELGFSRIQTAAYEQQEGILQLLDQDIETNAVFFYAHSSRARHDLATHIKNRSLELVECHLYDTHFIKPNFEIDFETIDSIFFPSTSTVESFFHYFPQPQYNIKYVAQGAITEQALRKRGISPIYFIDKGIQKGYIRR